MTMQEMNQAGRNNYQFVLVNDCSPDDGATISALRRLAEEYENVISIDLAKNAGQHNAIMAALRHADGDVIVGMDDDMQTHPSQIHFLLDKLEEGHDIVYGYYPEKKHSAFRKLTSKLNYWSVRVLIGKPKELKTSSFWVMKKFVKDSVIQYDSSFGYLQGLFLRATKDVVCVPIQHFEREVGQSGYTFGKLIKQWSGIIGVSIKPLRLSLWLGAILFAVGFIATLALCIAELIHPAIAIGTPVILSCMSLFSGINLLSIGMVGEYIGRTYLGMNKEPQYVIREIYTKKS